MISLHYFRENTTKIHENKQKLAIKTVRAADFRRLFISPAQERAPGNLETFAPSQCGPDRTITAPPTRIQHSWLVRAQGYNNIIYFPQLVPGSKTTVSLRNFTFSMHVAIWW